MISSFRAASGTRIRAEQHRAFRLLTRDGDPLTGITDKLPAEEAAIVATAVQRARDLNPTPPRPATSDTDTVTDNQDRDTTPPYTDADALLDICQHYLNTADTHTVPAGTSHTSTTEGAGSTPPAEDVPATSQPHRTPSELDADSNTAGVPAGTLRSQLCSVRGTGPIGPQTAQRLTCTGTIYGIITDQHGDVRALGRTRRLVSKRQRRALMTRDQICQFPGCWQDRHLQAHHIISWADGGTTDLDNLILLCRYHHIAVHEGGLTIGRQLGAPYLGARNGHPGWQFRMPDGQPIATTGRTIGGGEGFNLHNCVTALFNIKTDQDQQAA